MQQQKVIYRNMEFNHEDLPMHNNINVITKEMKRYIYMGVVEPKLTRPRVFGYLTQFIKCYLEDDPTKKQTFGLIYTKKGIFVSSCFSFMLVPTDKLLVPLARKLGIKYDPKEYLFLQDALEGIEKSESFKNGEVTMQKEIISFKMDDKKVRESFKQFYFNLFGKNMSKKPYIKPDIIVTTDGKKIVFEGERTFHKKKDFMWKLKRLKGKESKFSKIVFLFNGVDNLDYHMALIRRFERENNTRFIKVYYATMQEFKSLGEASLKYYKQNIIK